MNAQPKPSGDLVLDAKQHVPGSAGGLCSADVEVEGRAGGQMGGKAEV